ncbi:hypothetical protein [Saccharopolyspora pogona]|nr:hypothetical protein [Saccharopolyspora pogona]
MDAEPTIPQRVVTATSDLHHARDRRLDLVGLGGADGTDPDSGEITGASL